MKWYLASRTRHTNKMVVIAKFLETKGQQVISDWIYITDQLKPFTENLKRVQEISEANIQAMIDADALLMFNDLTGTDIFTELGIFMGKFAMGKKTKIYIVGDYDKTSLMQLHSSVLHFKNLQEVFDLEKIDYSNFVFPILD